MRYDIIIYNITNTQQCKHGMTSNNWLWWLVSQSQNQHGSKSNRQRPILPKPMQMQPELHQMWSHPTGTSVDSAGFAESQMDVRNRQGTISVQSLIADYRAKHPEEHPMRGRRIRQPSKIGGQDLNSSNSPTPPLNAPVVAPEASSVSFKVLSFSFSINRIISFPTTTKSIKLRNDNTKSRFNFCLICLFFCLFFLFVFLFVFFVCFLASK